MENNKKDKVVGRLEDTLKKLDTKDFNVYFFVLDTKGNPSGSIEYIYRTALSLFNMGYNVTMLHQEKEFIGVEGWLGTEYSVLKHANIDTENVEIGPADFLFVPEIFANVLVQTKSLPCKRVMIVQNYNHLSEFMPVGVVPQNLGVMDVITTTRTQEKMIKDYFPEIKTHVVSPAINPIFGKDKDRPKKLIVNIVSRNQEDVNRIVKPFFWKYPIYKFVSFRDLRGLSQEIFADALAEAAITVVCDDKSNFSYSALEAMRSGTVTIVKLPEVPSDWCVTETDGKKNLTNSCIWFDSVNEVPAIIASVVNAWTTDKIPDEVYKEQEKTAVFYSVDEQNKEITDVYVNGIFGKRRADVQEVLNKVNNE